MNWDGEPCMDKINADSKEKIYRAQGIVSVGGQYLSELALEIAEQYANGRINAEQAKQLYLNEKLTSMKNTK